MYDNWGVKGSEITPEAIFKRRRSLLKMIGAAGLSSTGLAHAASWPLEASEIIRSDFQASDKVTPESIATTYNNFYELGTGKTDPAKNSDQLIVSDPWKIKVSGACDKPGDYHLEDLIKPHALEDRVYRLRCVEAWSMVIPWLGIPLSSIIKGFEPNSSAKYVQFFTLMDPDNLKGQRRNVLDWPYREGLRMDEAMNPLTLLSVGAYGKPLLNQMGAPVRLVVPWKYGFKSIKSIVEIRFTEEQPKTSWNMSGPNEYGFYSNVNPEVSHPRWSQAKERRLDSDSSGFGALLQGKIKTMPFNGYGDLVADMYQGMDLRKHF